MIERELTRRLLKSLKRNAAVVLLGPRQVGKTTLAFVALESLGGQYVDLENAEDRQKMDNPRLFLDQHQDHLVVLDEIHRTPALFPELRGIIDAGRRNGKGKARFLLLGSASIDLLKQSGESLAGRVSYLELSPFTVLEVSQDVLNLWVRGGFPDSFGADNDKESYEWRSDFITTYIQRDIPELTGRINTGQFRQLLTMLAHQQGGLFNASALSKGLGVSSPTVSNYVNLLEELLLVRRLDAWTKNTGKRMRKSPKVFIRDSGLVHNLLRIRNYDELLGHPVLGSSWEGFVIEQILNTATDLITASFYRSAGGAELDLILEFRSGQTWAVEVKHSLTPSLNKGNHAAIEDISPDRVFVVYPGTSNFVAGDKVKYTVSDVLSLCRLIEEQNL